MTRRKTSRCTRKRFAFSRTRIPSWAIQLVDYPGCKLAGSLRLVGRVNTRVPQIRRVFSPVRSTASSPIESVSLSRSAGRATGRAIGPTSVCRCSTPLQRHYGITGREVSLSPALWDREAVNLQRGGRISDPFGPPSRSQFCAVRRSCGSTSRLLLHPTADGYLDDATPPPRVPRSLL
jgi:hypothetical protein